MTSLSFLGHQPSRSTRAHTAAPRCLTITVSRSSLQPAGLLRWAATAVSQEIPAPEEVACGRPIHPGSDLTTVQSKVCWLPDQRGVLSRTREDTRPHHTIPNSTKSGRGVEGRGLRSRLSQPGVVRGSMHVPDSGHPPGDHPKVKVPWPSVDICMQHSVRHSIPVKLHPASSPNCRTLSRCQADRATSSRPPPASTPPPEANGPRARLATGRCTLSKSSPL